MPKLPDIVPISDLRQDAARVLKTVCSSGQPIVITQRGRASAVMLSVGAYERGEYQRRLLLQIARGEREIAQGSGDDLDRVLREADEILTTRKP